MCLFGQQTNRTCYCSWHNNSKWFIENFIWFYLNIVVKMIRQWNKNNVGWTNTPRVIKINLSPLRTYRNPFRIVSHKTKSKRLTLAYRFPLFFPRKQSEHIFRDIVYELSRQSENVNTRSSFQYFPYMENSFLSSLIISFLALDNYVCCFLTLLHGNFATGHETFSRKICY
jgi:hypothetical protein